MMVEKRGLGRGLSALLGEVEETPVDAGAAGGLRDIPIELIHRNEKQPRWVFSEEEIEELAASIREKGVLQPILVRPAPDMDGHFEIVAGERRWRASQKAGLHVLPALVRELGDAQVLEIGVIENVQRSALNPIEEASAYQQLVEIHGRSAAEVADAVGKSRSHVANLVRLLALPDAVRQYLMGGQITAGHARALLGAEDPLVLADLVIAKGLSVRDTESLVRKSAGGGVAAPRPASPKPSKDTDTQALEVDLSEALGLTVEVMDKGGVGELRVKYATLEQLDEVCRRLTRA
ncbi:MAG: ParB/RepB/Spo0J family partition protein [Phenylobacterium sp.]|jgi:ParB family chromosome partitioning protein|uniref:ParB/RepB/Spo0J family partition protein n=1 Tax=Phenylobacterium sp. TaxID=1871053 RepID=UPI001B4FB71B|nr:ParB/RepB/Spo0J family partition protein [Phenylobacterium sp.]MBP7816444.1 ParB/RepB/Spo0J family partition protein [Phenylobacterium sp.]MBP9232412.1 ParB/RepB/Spo0J family partition protein [Phenylobacterium sp.]MBP9753807.1 ParB/RepB/Spo0J family partition protein [Phenylobacterium sp.]